MSNNDTKKLNIKQVKECDGNNGGGCFMDSCGHDCGCFIKVDEPKQQTLEEAAEKYSSVAFSGRQDLYDGFIAGAKYQSERMYSEQDMIEFGEWCENLQRDNKDIRRNNPDITRKELLEIWKEQFKKKQ